MLNNQLINQFFNIYYCLDIAIKMINPYNRFNKWILKSLLQFSLTRFSFDQ